MKKMSKKLSQKMTFSSILLAVYFFALPAMASQEALHIFNALKKVGAPGVQTEAGHLIYGALDVECQRVRKLFGSNYMCNIFLTDVNHTVVQPDNLTGEVFFETLRPYGSTGCDSEVCEVSVKNLSCEQITESSDTHCTADGGIQF